MATMHERIRQLRIGGNITLSQVAEALEVTEATAQRYESGKGIKTVPYEAIEKYAKLFNCSPQYIMGWDDVRNPEKAKTDALRDAEVLKDSQYVKLYSNWKLLNEPSKNIVIDLVELLAKQIE